MNNRLASDATLDRIVLELVSLKCVRTVGRRRCRSTGEKATVWDVTANLPGEPTQDQPLTEQPAAELARLRIENANLKLRLSRWGRPPKERRKTVAAEPFLALDGSSSG